MARNRDILKLLVALVIFSGVIFNALGQDPAAAETTPETTTATPDQTVAVATPETVSATTPAAETTPTAPPVGTTADAATTPADQSATTATPTTETGTGITPATDATTTPVVATATTDAAATPADQSATTATPTVSVVTPTADTQALHAADGTTYTKSADGKLKDANGEPVEWSAVGQLLDENNNVVTPTTAPTTDAAQTQATTSETTAETASVKVDATVTVKPIAQTLHDASGATYTKDADGNLKDADGKPVEWSAVGQLLDENNNVVEAPAVQPTAENQPTDDLVKSADPNAPAPASSIPATDLLAPPEIKEVTIQQEVSASRETDASGQTIDKATDNQNVVIEANGEEISVIAYVEVIDKVAKALINGKQDVTLIGDYNKLHVIAKILADVLNLDLDWMQIVHVYGKGNSVDGHIEVNAKTTEGASVETETRLEINMPKEAPINQYPIIQAYYGFDGNFGSGSYGGGSYGLVTVGNKKIERRVNYPFKLNEVDYLGDIINATEIVDNDNHKSFFLGNLKLRFSDQKTGTIRATIALAKNPDRNDSNQFIGPRELTVKSLSSYHIKANDMRVDLIGVYQSNNVETTLIFDSMNCSSQDERDTVARANGLSAAALSDSRNPDGLSTWTILPTTIGGYNNYEGVNKEHLFIVAKGTAATA